MSSVSAIAFGLIAAVRVIWLTGPDAFSDDPFPPTRVITRGPSHHWFGYYDKHQFDPSGRYVLGMRVDFEHRSPEPDDVIGVGML